jgi:16S rRNA (adenine(1408)-N(1))-methyltransferase
VAAPSDNSIDESFSSLSNHTGEGVVIDIGTGDGRYVLAAARSNANKFFIGIDANVKPLEKPSMKATRKPAKGGLPNAMFVQAAIEDLPDELDGVADEIHIHFSWGSLLRAVAAGEEAVLRSLCRIAAPGCLLEIVIGIDRERDKTEIERLGIPELSPAYLKGTLAPKFSEAGFRLLDHGELAGERWRSLETSWARRLGNTGSRSVTYLLLEKLRPPASR